MAKQHLGLVRAGAFVLWLTAVTLMASAALAEEFRGQGVGIAFQIVQVGGSWLTKKVWWARKERTA
jgi:hypothetical protein